MIRMKTPLRPLSLATLLLALIHVAFWATALPDADVRPLTWATNGAVWDVEKTPDTVYLGGTFTYVGVSTGNMAGLSVNTGRIAGRLPNVHGTVYAMIPDGVGGWFIGGDFRHVDGEERQRLARITPGGELDANFSPQVNGAVKALALAQDTLFVGGEFTRVNGIQRRYLAALRATGANVGELTTWRRDTDRPVHCLLHAPETELVYVGGNFESFVAIPSEDIEAAPRKFLAAFHTTTQDFGELADWHPVADATVETMILAKTVIDGEEQDDDFTLYVGGWFSKISDTDRAFIAGLNARTGEALAWKPTANNPVYALAADKDRVYAGGAFTLIGDYNRNYLAALHRDGGQAGKADTGWNPGENDGIDGRVTALALSIQASEKRLFVSGDFTKMGGEDRARLAAVHINNSQPAKDGSVAPWNPGAGDVAYVLTPRIVEGNETVFAAGAFTVLNGEVRHRLAGLDMEPFSTHYGTARVNEWNPHADNTVYALTLSQPDRIVYAGGVFENMGLDDDIRAYQHERLRLAAIDANKSTVNTYGKVRTDWTPRANDSVHTLDIAINISNNTAVWVYGGGRFSELSSRNGAFGRDRLGAIEANPANGNYGDITGWNPGWGGPVVHELLLSSDIAWVYLGGEEGTWGDVRRVDASAGAHDWGKFADPRLVYSLGLSMDLPTPAAWTDARPAFLDATLYAGGHFLEIADDDGFNTAYTTTRLAAFDPETGDLDTDWGPEASGPVWALEATCALQPLYVGGNFSRITHYNHVADTTVTVPRERFACLNTDMDTHPEAYGEPYAWGDGAPLGDGPVYDYLIDMIDNNLFAGGGFRGVNRWSRSHLAHFENLRFQPPKLLLLGDNPLTLECGDTFDDPGAVAWGACGDMSLLIVIDDTAVDMQAPGEYEVTYTVTDGLNTISATRRVVVEDTTGPVLTLGGADLIQLECGDAFTYPTATVWDACEGNIDYMTVVIDPHGFDSTIPGTHTVTYSTSDTDLSGNPVADFELTIEVEDSQPPVITLLGDTQTTIDIGDAYVDAGAEAIDACDGDITASMTITIEDEFGTIVGAVDTSAIATFHIFYSVSDSTGNSAATVQRTVYVIDPLLPSVSNVRVEDGWSVNIWFNLIMDAIDVIDPANYTISGSGRGTLSANPDGVDNSTPGVYRLFWNNVGQEMRDGGDITITVADTVRDEDGNVMSSPKSWTHLGGAIGEAPIITLNSFPNVLECNIDAYAEAGATAVDNIDGTVAVSISGDDLVDHLVPDVYEVTYTATDAAGNEAVKIRVVTVSDTLSPTLTLLGAATITIECGDVFSDTGATVADACDPTPTLEITGTVDASTPGAYPLTYRATDETGNVAEVTRNVTVVDTQQPIIALNGPVTVQLDCGEPYVEWGASLLDHCDGVIAGAVIVANSGSLNTDAPGVYLVEYSSPTPDGAGFTADPVERTVTVGGTPPTLTLFGGNYVTLECNDPFTEPGYEAYDECGASLTVTFTGDVFMDVPGVYPAEYSVTDSLGVTVTATRTFEVLDTEAPVITRMPPTPFILECGEYYNDPGATAWDQCEGDITDAMVTTNLVDMHTPGRYDVYYNVSDSEDNAATEILRTVWVEDTEPPVITLTQGNPLLWPINQPFSAPENDPFVVASDLCDGDLTHAIVATGTVNTNTLGTYPLTYTVRDREGLEAEPVTRIVEIIGAVPPVIQLLGDNPMSLECGETYVEPGAVAYDGFGQELAEPVVIFSDMVNPAIPGDYYVTYNFIDGDGVPAAEVVRVVRVQNTLPPVVSINHTGTLYLECHDAISLPSAFANDACDGTLPAGVTDLGGLDTDTPSGPYTVVYSATDTAGNIGTATLEVIVEDTQAPAITLLGGNPFNLECGTAYTEPGMYAWDDCDGDLTSLLTVAGADAVNTGEAGVSSIITYSVSDGSGNMATVTREVLTVDTLPPVIVLNGEPHVTLECGTEYASPGATLWDECEGMIAADIDSTGASVNTGMPGVYLVYYSASVTDAQGYAPVAVSRTVEVVDTTPPSLDPGTISADRLDLDGYILHECSEAFEEPTDFLAWDVCDGDLGMPQSTLDPLAPGVLAYAWALDATGALRWVEEDGEDVGDIHAYDAFIRVPGDYLLLYSACDAHGNTYPPVDQNGLPPIVDAEGNETFLDGDGNLTVPFARLVRVRDTVAPVVTLNGSVFMTTECGFDFDDPGARAWDACMGAMPEYMVSHSDTVNTNFIGTYARTYFAYDIQGNVGTTDRMVEVVDTLPPVITMTGSNPMFVLQGETFIDPGVTAWDACFGEITDITSASSVDSDNVGVYNVVYTATDSLGHIATAERIVYVNDPATLPIIIIHGPDPLPAECGMTFTPPDADAYDYQGNELLVTVTGAVDIHVPGSYSLFFETTDGINVVSVERIVQVSDTLAPQIFLLGDETVVVECGDDYQEDGAEVWDLCDGPLVSAAVDIDATAVNTQLLGVYPVLYTSFNSDSAGLSPLPTQRRVEVIDTTPPVLHLGEHDPASLVDWFHLVECHEAIIEPGDFWAYDVCSGDLGMPQPALTPGLPGVRAWAWRLDDQKRPLWTMPYTLPERRNYYDFTAHPGDYLVIYEAVDASGNIYPAPRPGDGFPPIFDGDLTSPDFLDGDGRLKPEIDFARLVRVVDTQPPTIILGTPPYPVEQGFIVLDCPVPYGSFPEPAGNMIWDNCAGGLLPVLNTRPVAPTPGVWAYAWALDDQRRPKWRVEHIEPEIYANSEFIRLSGDYLLLYEAIDGAGNVYPSPGHGGYPPIFEPDYTPNFMAGQTLRTGINFARLVRIKDVAAPTLTLQGANLITLTIGQEYVSPGATAWDACDGDITDRIEVDTSSLNLTAIGFYQVWYTVSDRAGNSALQVRIVNVIAGKKAPAYLDVADFLLQGFDAFDVDGDGILDADELDAAFPTLADAFDDLDKAFFDTLVSRLGESGDTLSRSALEAFVNAHTAPCDPDETAPVVHFEDVTLSLDAEGQASLFDDTQPYGTLAISYLYDNCLGAGEDNLEEFTISATQDLFRCNDVGTVSVTLTVTDGADNTTVQAITVTVVDNGQHCANIVDDEGEQDDGNDEGDCRGCGGCGSNDSTGKKIRDLLADWLLVGVAVLCLLGFHVLSDRK